jgi:endoglucanase
MNRFRIIAIVTVLSVFNILFAQQDSTKAKVTYHKWWEDRFFKPPLNSPDAKKLSLIRVQGNKFVDEKGNTAYFRGVSISDPDKVEHQGHWNKQHFEKLKEWGVKLVRIPVHPIAWRERTPEGYLALLDQAVSWCTEMGIYIIIDWHSIGNLKTQLFQDPMYKTTLTETYEFWRTVSWHFKGNNTVAFYEIFNEPTLFFGMLGPITWEDWKKTNEDIISMIRAFDKEKIPLVAGFDWAYDLTPLNMSPIQVEGIGYVSHPYRSKRTPPYEPKWEVDYGFAANKYPVIATEIGFNVKRDSVLNMQYGRAIVDYLEGRGISWLAWVFDPEWYPSMFQSWDNYKPTVCGEFFRQEMLKKTEAK